MTSGPIIPARMISSSMKMNISDCNSVMIAKNKIKSPGNLCQGFTISIRLDYCTMIPENNMQLKDQV